MALSMQNPTVDSIGVFGNLRRRIAAAAVLLLFALGAPLMTATPAQAVGKSSIHSCWSFKTSPGKNTTSAICNPPGDQYRFEIKCLWKNGSVVRTNWVSSPWTRDGARATAKCGNGVMIGIGATVYYNGKNVPVIR